MFYPSAICLLVLNDTSCLQVVDSVLFPFATLDASGGGIAEEGDQVDYQEEDQGQIADPGKPLHLLMSFVLLFSICMFYLFMQVHVYQMFYLFRAWHPQAGLCIYTPVWRTPR